MGKVITRTRRFKLTPDPVLERTFNQSLVSLQTWLNYGLSYLYKNYGCKRLARSFPTSSMAKRYLVAAMKTSAKNRYLVNPRHSYQDLKINIQSVDKGYEQLLTNFINYRHLQRVANHWSKTRQDRFQQENHYSLSGFGRIHYYASPQKATTLVSIGIKGNGGRIKVISPHRVKLPLFGVANTAKKMTLPENAHIQEACISHRENGDLELKLTMSITVKTLPAEPNKKAVVRALDLNQHDYAFANDDLGRVYHLPKALIEKYKTIKKRITLIDQQLLDSKDRHSLSNKRLLVTRRKKYVYAQNLLNTYYLTFAKSFCQNLDVLCLENLTVVTMRKKRPAKGKNTLLDRNRNKSLSILKFAWFVRTLTDQMEKLGKETRLVLADYTSKASAVSNYVNKNLALGDKRWFDPLAKQWLDRDTNAARNIKHWALCPEQHLAVRLGKRPVQEVLTVLD